MTCDGRFGDKTTIAVQAVVAGSSGLRIGGEEAAQLDIALAILGPEAQGGVKRQHDEYAPAKHPHGELLATIGTFKKGASEQVSSSPVECRLYFGPWAEGR